jgi:hypothetical protein
MKQDEARYLKIIAWATLAHDVKRVLNTGFDFVCLAAREDADVARYVF